MSDPRLPPLSHLQFLVLSTLLTAEQPGRVVREVAASYGVRRSGAAFYQLMARLERDGIVEGWYAPVQAGDQTVMERRYRITARGRRAWSATHAFNEAVAARLGGGQLSDA